MGPIPMVISTLFSIVLYSLMIFGVYKIFQISVDVNEMRDLLRDIRRNTQDLAPGSSQVHSPAPLSNALNKFSSDPAQEPEPAEWDK